MIFINVLFPLLRRVCVHGGRRCFNGLLKIFPLFSLFPVQADVSAAVFFLLWILFYGPYCCYIGFDLFQFRHSIEIDYILKFQISPHAFNFSDWAGILNNFGFKVFIDFNFILPCKFIINP